MTIFFIKKYVRTAKNDLEKENIMKRYKIWLVLLLSFAIGCGSSQQTDGEQKAENLMQTEAQKQEELSDSHKASRFISECVGFRPQL